jgi:hypothetical protein
MYEELTRWWSEGRAQGRGPRLWAWPIDHVSAEGEETGHAATAETDQGTTDVKTSPGIY